MPKIKNRGWYSTKAGVLRVLVVVLVVALGVALASCSLTRPSPVKRTFLLDPPLPAAVASAKPFTLRIGAFNIAAPYRDRAFVYRTEGLKYESDFYNEFFVAPAGMIAEATSKALAGARVFDRVVPSGTAPEEGEFVLEGFVTDLYADARTAKPEAEVAVSFYLSRTTFPSAVVWSRDYRERVALAANTPEALAQAWNAALGNVLARLVRDLESAALNPKPGSAG